MSEPPSLALDTSAFASFFRAQFSPTVRSVEGIAGTGAEDVTQEAFIVALQRWDVVAGLDAPDAWVRLVARRIAWRRRGREADRGAREGAVARSAHVASDDPGAIDLGTALKGLPLREQTAIRLHYLADLPVAQVAELLGCSEAAAKTRLHRARERLAESMIGHRGRWVSERRWRPEDITRRMHDTHDDEFTDIVIDELQTRRARWILTVDRGIYRLETDEGAPLDRGRSRTRAGALTLTPWNGSGEIIIAPQIDGNRARFRLVSDTTWPTRNVPDEVWLRLLLGADTYVWSGIEAAAPRM
jgi:RNA polymerase sigma-70 factor (ECF subfamily)